MNSTDGWVAPPRTFKPIRDWTVHKSLSILLVIPHSRILLLAEHGTVRKTALFIKHIYFSFET